MQCRYLVVEISPLSSSFWVITMYPWSLFSIFKLRARQARGILTPCYIYTFESKIMPSLYTLIVSQPYSANFPLISLLMYCHKKFKAFKKKKSLRDSVLLVKVPLLNRDLCTLLTTLRTSLSSQKYQPFNLISFEARKILIFYELS